MRKVFKQGYILRLGGMMDGVESENGNG